MFELPDITTLFQTDASCRWRSLHGPETALYLLLTAIGIPLLVLLPAVVNADPQDQANEIIQRSTENLKKDWAAEPRFDCSERDQDKNGIRTYRDLMLYGSQYQKLIAVNDRPLDERQQAEQEQKFQAAASSRRTETSSQRRQRIAKYAAQRKHATELILEFTKAFNFTLTGTSKLGERDVYVLTAEPRKGYVPPNTDTRVLTGMHGKLWIERTSFQWVKVEVEVFHPVSIGGFVARVEPGTRFLFEQQPVSSDIWLPSHFAVNSHSKVMFIFNRQTDEDDTFSDYQPAQNSGQSGGH